MTVPSDTFNCRFWRKRNARPRRTRTCFVANRDDGDHVQLVARSTHRKDLGGFSHGRIAASMHIGVDHSSLIKPMYCRLFGFGLFRNP